ncbi:SpoIIE family protein phosphatase [Streptomyces sp. ARC12]|uniref:ATP-binding SpoIIE family protein phosphatase n=1 Tax=Streptomyces TaxID=1883 RepID=UPI0006FA1549|nr:MULTISPECIES: SpoIIE family protein phosphatase [Streptomyces]KQX37610.1 PAS sensor protein [Streptomyces sp. Root1295]KRA43318.1 PAS sensor protein [Streptomyces sp. Root63]MBT1099750.1 SpoIIE family protein phosphatase [Streptomyces sp. Tu10]WTC64905.1 SpoIIE family protein phosphatase [Streptomyces anulatus]WUC88369.1 SpoIIE family protein phosphatase [Streptomyces anulatus]
MNFTRWSARLPGTQRRAAARDDRSSVPAARAESARADGSPALPDDPSPASSGPASTEALPGPALDDLSAREILGRLPAPVALLHGPDHRVAYVNDAYEAAFGPRPSGVPAAEAMPELTQLSVVPLLDQVLRSGTARTVKSRRTAEGGSYTVTCTPVTAWSTTQDEDDKGAGGDGKEGDKGDGRTDGRREGGVLVYAADVTDHAEAAERLRTSERRHRETAVTLQRSLLPQELEQPDDLRIAATYQPGGTDAAVGGDWYDVITLGAGRTALVIGDVMGRGVRAAAVMGQLRTAVRAYARLDLPPHEVIQLLDVLAAEIDASQIATCVYAVHDPNEGHLVYASAGHLPILVCDEDGTVHRAADPTGPPLGTGGWVHTSGTIALPPGSTAVLYTDGLVERRSEDIDEGVASLARALSGAKGSPQVVCDRLIRSLGVTAEHDDDVAVLVVQHPARTGTNAELFHNAALDLLGGIEAAPRARAFATGVLTSWRFPVELRDLGVLATSELVANSLQHGTPPMRLGLRRTDRRLIIEVTDGDDHLPRRRQAEPADEAGRGISIIASIATSWGSRRTPGGGKAVWCEFALPR